MSEFPEPQQESAAACENRDIGPFRKGPKLQFYSLHICKIQIWKHSDFTDPISENYFGRVPGPCEHCHYLGGSKFAGSYDPFKIFF